MQYQRILALRQGFCRRIEKSNEFFAVVMDALKLLIIEISCLVQDLKPVLGFRAFLERNVDLGSKVVSGDGFLCLGKIRTDTGAAPQKLIGESFLLLCFYNVIIQLYDPNRELFTPVICNTVTHNKLPKLLYNIFYSKSISALKLVFA